ncbi:MAG: YcxB family protein [Lachnospiraceae bacterium]|jgi:hypothetical protein|nr:YcxB family protein [Lachnospiraceae bacterium]
MKISVKITEKDLFAFSMYNSYTGFTGALNAVFSLGALILLALSWEWTTVFQKSLLAFCFLLFAVIQPAILYRKSKKQAKGAAFLNAIDMTFLEDKIVISQGESSGEISWEEIWKVVQTRGLYILRTGPTRAYLVPRPAFMGQEKQFIELIKRILPAYKTKGVKG